MEDSLCVVLDDDEKENEEVSTFKLLLLFIYKLSY